MHLAAIKTRIMRSVADSRPGLTIEQARQRLRNLHGHTVVAHLGRPNETRPELAKASSRHPGRSEA
jgi:hypothetical protein